MIPFENAPLLITFGRDVTERRKLEREREEWHSQLSHRQRLEAIGRLAGGIAHDFNNYIHAIQGHLDIIKYMHEVQDEDIRRNLDKIDHITELAGTLTSQMLSFARKGNYQNVDVDIRMLVDNKPGVLAAIASVFGVHKVSIARVIQKTKENDAAELVIVTEAVKEKHLEDALAHLVDMDTTREIGTVIREY